MARDAKTGRPIPAYVPPPPDTGPKEGPPIGSGERQQLLLAMEKNDLALSQLADHGQRISALEEDQAEKFTEAVHAVEQKFSDLLFNHIQESEKRYATLAEMVNRVNARPPYEPPNETLPETEPQDQRRR
jgi:hypothetical protein